MNSVHNNQMTKSNSQIRSFKIMTISTYISCSLFACTKKASEAKDPVAAVQAVPASSTPDEMIMIKSGEKTPTLSKVETSHWLQVRQQEGSSRDKLYGLLATGEWQAAADEAKKQLEKVPGDNPTMLALAAAYATGHNYEMANFYAGLVLKSDPGNADAMNISGLRIMMASQNHRGDYEDALTWFRKASDHDNTHVAGLLNMGYLQLELGDAANAAESFNLAQSRCRQCYAAVYGYGVANARIGSWDKAKSSFEQILKKDNGEAEAQYQLALIYKNGLNDKTTSMKLLQEIVSDADGRFKNEGQTKRVANITLRRMKANDRSGPMPVEAIMPHGDELPARAN